MSVRLRHAESGYFYAGPRRWVPDARQAHDLESVGRAREMMRRDEFRGIGLVACVGERESEWMLPLRPGREEAEEILHSDSWRVTQPRNHPPPDAPPQEP